MMLRVSAGLPTLSWQGRRGERARSAHLRERRGSPESGLFHKTFEDKLLPFRLHAIMVVAIALSCFLMRFKYDGSMLTKPKLAHYCEHGLFSYAIEWKRVGADMDLVSHFNTLWSRKQAKTASFYTLDSYSLRR